MKHSAAYNIGYKLGTADGKRGGAGLPDGSRACNSGTGVNGTAATNQCLAGYFFAWNKYCPTSGCISEWDCPLPYTFDVNRLDSIYYCIIGE
jgi:hypothetical protein